jgi:hypothetical protein
MDRCGRTDGDVRRDRYYGTYRTNRKHREHRFNRSRRRHWNSRVHRPTGCFTDRSHWSYWRYRDRNNR